MSSPLQTKRNFILEVKGFSLTFVQNGQENKVLSEIGFSIRPGEAVGVVGESGSGKSVTALSLMHLLGKNAHAKGEVFLNTEKYGRIDLMDCSKGLLRQLRGGVVSMIFQEPMSSLNPVFRCGEQVMEAIFMHERTSRKGAKARVLSLFNQVHLSNPEQVFNSYPHELSGGQKQRVMIAMAMACRPALLIADEPTTALDVTIQAEILKLFRELREKYNTAILFITHDLGVVAEIADRILVMYHGEIVEEGDVLDIFTNPTHAYTKGLLACRPRLDIHLKVLPVLADFMQTDESGRISGFSEPKFASVGQALMLNYQTDAEIRKRQEEAMSKPPIVEVKDLCVSFPSEKNIFGKVTKYTRALKNVSLKVYPGETLGLVGESGCGKSTLGRSIMRLLEVDSGQIFFEGQDITRLSGKELRRMRKDFQIIFQDPYASLNPRLTVGEAILEPMRLHNIGRNERERKQRAAELLELVHLNATHLSRYPHEFSGGQRQRISIARSLAVEPKFLICDESVSALDVSVQAQVLNLLNRLKELYNLTYIFISHDLAVIKFISDRVLVMNEGKIVERGFMDEVYKAPKEAYTQKLINAIPEGNPDKIRKKLLQRKLEEG